MGSFKQKVVWITGASSGIGEALAYALSQRGARLILSSRRQEALQAVKNNCNRPAEDIQILPLDLSDPESLPDKASQALGYWGHIDYLFNNGGVSQRSEVTNTDMDVIRKVMEINFFGTIGLTKAVLPSMIERGQGHIVVTSSVTGKFSTQLRSTYAASKHALHGWYDALRLEVESKGVDVTLVCPGYIKTDVTLNALSGDGSRHGKMGRGQSKGMDPEVFAEKLLPKIEKGQNEIYIGGSELLPIYLKRFAPRLLDYILRRVNVT